MTVQLYEGCWGVTQSRERRGPIGLTKNDGLRNSYPFCDPDRFTYGEDGSYGMKVGVSSPNDIIAVFATEAEADAYLAQESHKPIGQIVREEYDRLRAKDLSGVKHAVNAPSFTFAPAPKPVTWPHRVSGPFTAESDWLTLISDAMTEANKAMVKFPQPNYVISKFAEEAGEVVKAAIHCAEGRETPQNLRGEIKQAIAMLYRLWNEGDQVHGLQPVAALLLAAADKVEGRG